MLGQMYKYKAFMLAYMLDIEPRRIELAKLMGTHKQIPVFEITTHEIVDDIDTDSDGEIAGNYGKYCWKCRLVLDEITSNDCRIRVGK